MTRTAVWIPPDATHVIESRSVVDGLFALQNILQGLHDVAGLSVRVLLILCFHELSIHRRHAHMLAVGHNCECYASNQARDVGQPENGAGLGLSHALCISFLICVESILR